MEYRPRIVDPMMVAALDAAGAVVIEGPKASGKTETGRRAARSEIRVDTLASLTEGPPRRTISRRRGPISRW